MFMYIISLMFEIWLLLPYFSNKHASPALAEKYKHHRDIFSPSGCMCMCIYIYIYTCIYVYVCV